MIRIIASKLELSVTCRRVRYISSPHNARTCTIVYRKQESSVAWSRIKISSSHNARTCTIASKNVCFASCSRIYMHGEFKISSFFTHNARTWAKLTSRANGLGMCLLDASPPHKEFLQSKGLVTYHTVR